MNSRLLKALRRSERVALSMTKQDIREQREFAAACARFRYDHNVYIAPRSRAVNQRVAAVVLLCFALATIAVFTAALFRGAP